MDSKQTPPGKSQKPQPEVMQGVQTAPQRQNTTQDSALKPSRWRYVFIILGLLQIIGIVLFILGLALLILQSRSGVSGTEFTGLYLISFFIPVMAQVALVNLLGLFIYMIIKRPRGKALVLCMVSLLVSAIIIIGGVYAIYQKEVVIPERVKESSKLVEELRENLSDNTASSITKEEAVALIQSCKVVIFQYEDVDQSDFDSERANRSLYTNVVTTKPASGRVNMRASANLGSELVSIVRKSQETCKYPPGILHNGSLEHESEYSQ